MTDIEQKIYHLILAQLTDESAWQNKVNMAEKLVKGICKFIPKLRLPENPYRGDIDFHQNIRLATRQGFDEAIQQVKELNGIRDNS